MHARTGTGLGGAAAALAIAACATPTTGQMPAQAASGSAAQFGVAAATRAPAMGQGYSARDRHMADCLATYPGYNPATDQIAVRPGVTDRCPL